MEVAGLAIGIAGLAGLFSTSLDAISKFDSWKDSGIESRSYAAQFEAHRLRLEKWGKAVGILNVDKPFPLSEDHNKLLDDQRTCTIVGNLLQGLYDITCRDDGASRKSNAKRHSHLHVLPESTRQRIGWAFLNKPRRMAQVQQISSMVDALHGLIPPDRDGGMGSRNADSAGAHSPFERSDGALLAREDWVTEFERAWDRIEMQLDAEARRDVQKWLLGDHIEGETYRNHIQDRVGDTCNWILSRPWFLDWSSADISQAKTLWINGPAGFGKSVLCARIIEHLSSPNPEAPVAYFFFSSQSENRNDPFLAVRSWETQMISHPTAFMLLRDKWLAQHGQRATRETVMDTLQDIITTIPGCTLILDGLDECSWPEGNSMARHGDTPSGFLEALLETTRNTATRLLVVSRDEPKIRACFPKDSSRGSFFEHKITTDDVDSDIATYAEDVVDKALREDKSSRQMKAISQKLAARCKGQFLWIGLHGGTLQSHGWRSQGYLEREIDSTPDGLEHVYERYWTKITNLPERDRHRAISVLRWATFSLRPLKIAEITEALATSDQRNEIDLDELPDRIDRNYIDKGILSSCGSLLELRSPEPECDAASMTVQLAHFSIKQYLLYNLPTAGTALQPNSGLTCFGETAENTFLAKICLRYLNCASVWRKEPDVEDAQSLGSLLTYATDSWQRHASLGGSDDNGVLELVNQLFDPRRPIWALWIKWVALNEKGHGKRKLRSQDGPTGPLYYAASLGLTQTIEFLIRDRQHSPDEKGDVGQTALGAACENNRREAAKMLIDNGAEINVTCLNGWAPIYLACRDGYIEVVELLLQHGANATMRGAGGWTPLIMASEYGHLEIVKLLLEKGDLRTSTQDGWTPLIMASEHGHLEVVKLLLERGADLRTSTHDGRTPLFMASEYGHLDIVKLLLEKGGDLRTSTHDGQTPLFVASEYGHLEVVKLLLEKEGDLHTPSHDGKTPLFVASEFGHLEVAKLLLEKGGDLHTPSHDGKTPLFVASECGHLEVAKLLLEKGADLRTSTHDGWTPIHSALRYGHPEMAKLLIKSGADIRVATHNGWMPIHLALRYGHPETAKLLIKSGVDIRVVTHDGWMPIHFALRYGHPEMAKLLIKSGVDIRVATHDGWMPIHFALRYGHPEMAKLLIKSGADVRVTAHDGWTPIHFALRYEHPEMAKLLIKSGADIRVTAHDGLTPIHFASRYGYLEVAELLIESGADVCVAQHDGWTPIHFASYFGYLEVAELLVKSGADVCVANPKGSTPLHFASCNGHLEVVKLLIEARVDITVMGGYGESPLHQAAPQGQLEAVQPLLVPRKDCIDPQDKLGRTALFHAASRGHYQVAEWLLSQNACANTQDRYSSTPLCAAVRNGHVKIVELFLPLADITDFQDGLGRNLVWWASRSRCPQVVPPVQEWAQKMGLSIHEDDLTGGCSLADSKTRGWCDVCTRPLIQDHGLYHCSTCPDFDMCLECYELGGTCLDVSHDWTYNTIPGNST